MSVAILKQGTPDVHFTSQRYGSYTGTQGTPWVVTKSPMSPAAVHFPLYIILLPVNNLKN
jgi:hypothetical protein